MARCKMVVIDYSLIDLFMFFHCITAFGDALQIHVKKNPNYPFNDF